MPVLNSQASRFSRLSFVLSFSVLSPINLVQPTNNKLPRDQQFVISSVATLLRPACLPEWVKGVRQLQPLELQQLRCCVAISLGTHIHPLPCVSLMLPSSLCLAPSSRTGITGVCFARFWGTPFFTVTHKKLAVRCSDFFQLYFSREDICLCLPVLSSFKNRKKEK